ncbi:MAG: tyrosine-type recombinase/integrase [Candidatus Pacearchaeota archaeon]
MKIDPYNHKEKYKVWQEKMQNGIQGVSKINSELIMSYLNDMERGANIALGSVKGARSYNRLNSLRDKLCFFAKQFETRFQIELITSVSEDQLMNFFADMKSGVITRVNGGIYASVDTYARIFKAFWHWHQKINRKKGIEIKDITTDLDTRQDKPKWVYLTEEEVRKLAENAIFDHKVLIYFLFDSGIRAPTELVNVRVSDLFNEYKELNIRQETSKTFGRRIKLMICPDLLKEYVKSKKLQPDDQLFNIDYSNVNRYLKRLANKIFGDKSSPAGEKYCNITMYDFRHVSCCYWLPRYKSESALKYRFGWKKSDKIHYYSELLGMKDTIAEEDLFIDTTKTDLEKRLERTEKEKELMQEKMKTMEMQFANIMELVKQLKQSQP